MNVSEFVSRCIPSIPYDCSKWDDRNIESANIFSSQRTFQSQLPLNCEYRLLCLIWLCNIYCSVKMENQWNVYLYVIVWLKKNDRNNDPKIRTFNRSEVNLIQWWNTKSEFSATEAEIVNCGRMKQTSKKNTRNNTRKIHRLLGRTLNDIQLKTEWSIIVKLVHKKTNNENEATAHQPKEWKKNPLKLEKNWQANKQHKNKKIHLTSAAAVHMCW